ncbi:Gfo/Idh/MocA family protein [Nakamurella leprariae]|uniref:Gfo/Idh/MocA family oxidoreductase n=1 Tax=Nakamurella leprariae TaxID=2803911 RepID=A0A939C3E9_9ACTN|nr:Gfo/Idh/MocA family oxidoreductase [Nakamurella leprariae]MBM9469032.1 Gfo/Idh/MocA family oxidoreductase [Nakamurella leprariae]
MSQPSRPVRIGIVGAGIRGSLFARSISQHPDATVVAICDRAEALARALAVEHDARSFTDHRELLAAGLELDALVVATPDFAHRDVAVDAAQAGLHLLIEKPLATTTDDARAITDAVERAGVKCVVGFENRWNPRFVAAKELIDAGSLGTVLTQVAHLHDTVFVPTEMLSWAGRSSPAWFLMPHTLDLLLWLTGKQVVSVYATGVKQHLVGRGVDTWDSVDASLTFTDGTTATLHSAWVLPVSHPAVYDLRVELVGTESALRIQGADQGVHLFSDQLRWAQWGTFVKDGRLQGFPVEMAVSFIDHLLGRITDIPGLADGLVVTRVISAIDRSLASGQPEPVADPA